MTAIPNDLMQDYRDVELACDECGEAWSVRILDGDDLTYEQTECPIAGCDGEGEEL